jgi:hypothetical protein
MVAEADHKLAIHSLPCLGGQDGIIGRD